MKRLLATRDGVSNVISHADQIRRNVPREFLDVALEAARIADELQQGAVLVGGVVRDLLMGRSIDEVDLMFDPPVRPIIEKLASQVECKVVTHDTFHTFTLILPLGSKVDVVTAREETYRAPACLPDVFPSSIPLDLKRRDFTVNAMAFWINKDKFGELLDPYNGYSDLKNGVLRILHHLSFVDDPTRVYRAARFAGRFNFKLETETEGYLRKSVTAGLPSRLTPVRRRHEFELILKEENPLPALQLLQSWGAIKFLHPEWEVLPAHRAALASVSTVGGPTFLLHRLKEWFRPWGKDLARMMMTDLCFEKKVKTEVLKLWP